MSTVNIPLLRKAVEWAEAEAAKPPELCEWNQGAWVVEPDAFQLEGLKKAPECGTCYCIAGYVVAVSGEPMENIAGRAEDLLGLGLFENRLFRCCNTIEDVRRIAEDIAGERL